MSPSITCNEEDTRRVEALASRLISKVHQIPSGGELTVERLKEASIVFRELQKAMRKLEGR